MIIVRKLTKEVIQEAIKAYLKDETYYLKFYVGILNVLNKRYKAREKLLDDLLEKGESIHIENYAFIDFNINND
jgi:hypothetical protein